MQETLTNVETVRRELGAALLIYKAFAPIMIPNLTAGAEAFIQICRRLADAEKRIAQLEAALRQVQWGNPEVASLTVDGGLIHLCPMCDQTEKRGHSPDCLVGMALDVA